MTITSEDSAAATLRTAEQTRTTRRRITAEWDGLDLETGYRIQKLNIGTRVDGGDRVIGTKLGLTSVAKQQRMGVDSPITGVLLESYLLNTDAPVPLDRLIHPRLEPEIVFVMKERLEGPGITAVAALAAVDRVYGGFEIIDSRFTDFDFTMPDVVADNASSAFFTVGTLGVSPHELDLALEAVVLSVNGRAIYTATGAAVQGHPAEALAMAANALAARGQHIEAGEIILTGGLTDAIPIQAGDQVAVEFTNLGSLFVTAQ